MWGVLDADNEGWKAMSVIFMCLSYSKVVQTRFSRSHLVQSSFSRERNGEVEGTSKVFAAILAEICSFWYVLRSISILEFPVILRSSLFDYSFLSRSTGLLHLALWWPARSSSPVVLRLRASGAGARHFRSEHDPCK